VDARAGTREPYAEVPLIFSPAPELAQGLRLNFSRPHPGAGALAVRDRRPLLERRAWLAAARGQRLFVVGPEGTGLLGLPEPPADLAARVRREQTRRFDGIFPIDVEVWGPR
jgi:hypothetical protein